jgi:hypothetical protein
MTGTKAYSVDTDNGHTFLTKQMIEDARDWVSECEWADMDDDDLSELTDKQIIQGITRHFDGGWSGFLASY